MQLGGGVGGGGCVCGRGEGGGGGVREGQGRGSGEGVERCSTSWSELNLHTLHEPLGLVLRSQLETSAPHLHSPKL